MCGRFTFEYEWPAFIHLYDLSWQSERGRNTEARFIAPTQTVLIVHNDADDTQVAGEARWWLVPFWAKELPKAAMFNAHIEAVDTAPAFRETFKSKRCLILTSAFYEWAVSEGDGKEDPWLIHLPGDAPSPSPKSGHATTGSGSQVARSSPYLQAIRCRNSTTGSQSFSIPPRTKIGSIRRCRLTVPRNC
jgi:hypothetical protein